MLIRKNLREEKYHEIVCRTATERKIQTTFLSSDRIISTRFISSFLRLSLLPAILPLNQIIYLKFKYKLIEIFEKLIFKCFTKLTCRLSGTGFISKSSVRTWVIFNITNKIHSAFQKLLIEGLYSSEKRWYLTLT